MELFKSKELKNEFEEMKKLLPSIIDCNYCQKEKCIYHSRFIVSCTLCRNEKCKSCFKFNISKSILFKNSSKETNTYLTNFISDFFNINTLSLQHFFPEVKIEKKQTVQYTKRVKSEKNRAQIVKSELPSNVRSTQFQHGKFKHKVYY